MEEKYFKFSTSDDSDWLWGYAVGNGKSVINDSTDISMNTIKKVDVNEATRTLLNWLYNDCNITADRNYVARAVSRAFEKGQYVMEFDPWWDGFYEEFCECTLEATDNPLADWEELEDGLYEAGVKEEKTTEDRFDRIRRLFKKAGHWVSGFATEDHDGPNGEAVWVGDGGWKTINYTRSDEDIINDIKKLEDD